MIDSFTGEYRFLSNFSPAPVFYDGVLYTSVEHAFQAAKTYDISERMYIRSLEKPGQAKSAGKRVTLRPGWDGMKVNVMRELIRQKFAAGTELADRLLATGNAELIEGNHHNDTFWGVCNGVGQNWLGTLLMEQRSALRCQ